MEGVFSLAICLIYLLAFTILPSPNLWQTPKLTGLQKTRGEGAPWREHEKNTGGNVNPGTMVQTDVSIIDVIFGDANDETYKKEEMDTLLPRWEK